MKRCCLTFLAAALFLNAALADKLRLLQSGRYPANSRVAISAPEIRQWIQADAAYWTNLGVTSLRFTLAQNRATGYAGVDFLKARKATTGADAGWLLRNLFSGRKPVAVTARFSSARGQARVDIETLQVNGITLDGIALDFLIQNFVRPSFPEARISEWFPMDYRVDHFTVAPAGITLYIGK